MKERMFKYINIMIFFIVVLLTLSSCLITENAAKRIQKATDNNKPYTYGEVQSVLGEPTITYVNNGNGTAIWVKGYKKSEYDQIDIDIQAGKEIKCIIAYFEDNKCLECKYDTYVK